VRLFGEEIAVKAHIHTLGASLLMQTRKGFSIALSLWNPNLEVFVVHGEEKVSLELSQLIRAAFTSRRSCLGGGEKASLQGSGTSEEVIPSSQVRRVETEPAFSHEDLPGLLRSLDHNYKKLRRKLRRVKEKGRLRFEARWAGRLEEINRRLEDLDSDLDKP